jgi:hypothetical protein
VNGERERQGKGRDLKRRNQETTKPQNHETAKPRNHETAKSRNHETAKPRNRETAKPRNMFFCQSSIYQEKKTHILKTVSGDYAWISNSGDVKDGAEICGIRKGF